MGSAAAGTGTLGVVCSIICAVILVLRAAGRQNEQRARDEAAQKRHNELIKAMRAGRTPPTAAAGAQSSSAAAGPDRDGWRAPRKSVNDPQTLAEFRGRPRPTPGAPGRARPAPPAQVPTAPPPVAPPADAIPTAVLLEAAWLVITTWTGSREMLQDRLRLGPDQAERVLDELERYGIVGPDQGEDPRVVLTLTTRLDEALARIRSGPAG